MRALFARRLHRYLAETPAARLLTADIGYGVLDAIRSQHRAQCQDFGAAEQLMIGAACGMALSGLQPICYSITPFLLYRPLEWIRNFLNHDKIPVKLVGVGIGRDYGNLGFTHWAEDASEIMRTLPNIRTFIGMDEWELFFNCEQPAYLNLRK
jgi:transketolase